MKNKKQKVKIQAEIIIEFLRLLKLKFKNENMPNGLGCRFIIENSAFKGLIINCYKTESVTVQGGDEIRQQEFQTLLQGISLVMARGLNPALFA